MIVVFSNDCLPRRLWHLPGKDLGQHVHQITDRQSTPAHACGNRLNPGTSEQQLRTLYHLWIVHKRGHPHTPSGLPLRSVSENRVRGCAILTALQYRSTRPLSENRHEIAQADAFMSTEFPRESVLASR